MGTRRSNNNQLGNQNYILKNGAYWVRKALIENIRGPKILPASVIRHTVEEGFCTYGHGGEISIVNIVILVSETRNLVYVFTKVGDRVLISHDVNMSMTETAHSLDA